MSRKSAGILIYRHRSDFLEVLLVHPGGPLWKNKDAGAWTIPKGEPETNESLEQAALRETSEELGVTLRHQQLTELRPIQQRGGKWVHAFACEADLDVSQLHSNHFEMTWPPRSGKRMRFPEVDRAEYFDLPRAREKINAAQTGLLDELVAKLDLTDACP